MLCHFYLRKGIVYVPTLARVDQAYYSSVEPVAVVPMSNTESLRRVLLDTIARGNPAVPRLSPGQSYSPVTLKYAGIKNWSTFERGTSYWNIEEENGIFRVVAHRKAEQGWEEDENGSETFPKGTSVVDVVDRMIAILQGAAAKKRSD
jgi:hypothetical protein